MPWLNDQAQAFNYSNENSRERMRKLAVVSGIKENEECVFAMGRGGIMRKRKRERREPKLISFQD